jgi:hypothetical protein
MEEAMKELALPVPCLNGNTKQSIIDELLECRAQLEHALIYLRRVEFTNGRNFQLSDPLTRSVCLEQHNARIKAIEGIALEFLTMAYEVQEKS